VDVENAVVCAPAIVLFLLPAGIYELRVCRAYFREGKELKPISFYITELICSIMPYKFEEFLEHQEKTWGPITPRRIAISSGLQGGIFILIVIFSVVTSVLSAMES
jgi:hypothetical protein